MKEYLIKVNKNKLISPDIKLVQNDYNSTKFVFEFDIEEDLMKIFQLQLPSGVTWRKEIINNEIVLADEKNTELVPILVEEGMYEFDIAIYDSNSKLTTTDKAYFRVRQEIDGVDVTLDDRVPLLDYLINETRDAVNEADNLDINLDGTVITVTKKDGTTQIQDIKGDKGEPGDLRLKEASAMFSNALVGTIDTPTKEISIHSAYGNFGAKGVDGIVQHDLQLYGESTQEGEPTPTAPIEIESVSGKNKWNNNLVTTTGIIEKLDTGFKITSTEASRFGPTYSINFPAGSYKLYGNVETNAVSNTSCFIVNFSDGTQTTRGYDAINYGAIVFEKDVVGLQPCIGWDEPVGTYYSITDFMIMEANEEYIGYVPYNHIGIKSVGENGQESITTIPLLHDMRSLPNGVRDRIYYSNGKWYDEQNVGEYIFTGNEIISGPSLSGGTEGVSGRFSIKHGLTNYKNSTQMLCTHFLANDTTYGNDKTVMQLFDNEFLLRLNYSELNIQTAEELNTYFAEQYTNGTPVKVYYPLAEPIVTEITDETMIQGLESIRTFTGTTNITSDILMTGSYVKDINKVIADLTNLLTANSES